MATATKHPTEAQVEAFVKKLRAYGDTLPEDEQPLLNSMFLAAVGNRTEQNSDVGAYWWVYPYTYWYGSPWGYSYNYYYPAYW